MTMVAANQSGARAGAEAATRVAFVTGCGRSGTTILGTILSHHEDISYINDRFDLWIRPFGVTDIWGYRADSAKFNPRIDLGPTDAALQGERRERFYELLEVERRGKKVLVEKLAINNFRLGFLMALCPDAALINIVRHGVEVAFSIEQKANLGQWYGEDDRKWKLLQDYARANGFGHVLHLCRTPFEKGLLEWRMSVEAAERYLASSSPPRLCRLRYEQLIENPRAVCASLVEFLGLPSSERMNQFASTQVARKNPAASERRIPESAEAIAGETLRRLGYTISSAG